MKVYLFDDRVADGWRPFALTRPIGELRFGALLGRERVEEFVGVPVAAHLTRPWLADYSEPGAPPVVDPAEALAEEEDRLFLSSRFIPPAGERFSAPPDAAALAAPEGVAGCYLPAGTDAPKPGWLERPDPLDGAEELEVGGRLLSAAWELVRDGPERVERDALAFAPEAARAAAASLPEGVRTIGPGPLFIEEGVRLEPGILLDGREGPIWLRGGVEVRAGSRLAGPLFAGRKSRLLGGPIEATSAGPVSYLRGELSMVTTLGHVNKAHAGFIGHSYLGRWVNLGAGTTNSDLKNNYGPVRLGGPEGPVETGLTKLGCLLGDHVKTAIGSLLNTGTVVGAGANLFGEGRPPRWVPPFSWGWSPDGELYRREAFLATAETVLGRRDVPFDDRVAAWLGAAWDAASASADPTGGKRAR